MELPAAVSSYVGIDLAMDVQGRSTYGGGVYLSRGSATIRDCTFTTNYISSYGASSSYPLYGGALYASGVSTLTVSNCVFSRNYAKCTLPTYSGSRGGVMYLSGVTNAVLTDCKITNNFGWDVIESLYINTPASPVSFGNSIFTGSSSNAIRKDGAGALALTNCLIATNRGDGLYVTTGTVTVAGGQGRV